jgi:hypothetical protein
MMGKHLRSRSSRAVILLAVFGAVSSLSAASAQSPSPMPIQIERVPLVEWAASRPHARPETLPNFETNAGRAAQFKIMLRALVDHAWPQAAEAAKSLSYMLVQIQEAGQTFVAASDDSNTGRDPTVIINMAPRRDFVVQAPHVPFEAGTAEQAAILLRDLGGRAAIISGAHRCASRSFTTCDGTTAVCGVSQNYRDSDPGHNVSTLFHAAHILFTESWPSSVVISLHGMREDNEGVRTSLIISNGIRADDTSQQTAATKFRVALGRSIKEPGVVVSCNLPDDAVYRYRKLCGFTNVQGRHVNGDAEACRTNVDQGTGRFIHMEQDGSILQHYSQNWRQIDRHAYHSAFVRALEMILPPTRRP